MFFPARIQNSRGAIVSYLKLRYLVCGIFEKYQCHFFGRFPLNLTLDFFELTKCNFRRHFGGLFGKKTWNFMCLECFLIALPQQRHLNKWNRCYLPHRVGQTSFPSGIVPRATPSVSIPLMEPLLARPLRQEH